jgi:hypothetical protein
MKFKACAIAALLVFGGFLPVFVSYASESNEMDISQLVPHRDQEVRADKYTEKSTIVTSSLKLFPLQEESRTEKRSISLAEPQDTLRGLKGVMVFVEDIDTDVENHGLTKGLLKKEVESRLRQADIPVLTRDEAFNMQGKPYLYLNLTTHNTGIELYSYAIRIEFNQDVCMIREPSIRASATTWIANVVGIVGARNLPAVTEDVTQLTDTFIHDYLAANQRPQ